MSRRFLDPDFYEGVRAALIDKDGNPQWSPNSINDSIQIDSYFAKHSTDLELWNKVYNYEH